MAIFSWRTFSVCCAAVLSAACSSEVALTEVNIPKPLVTKMPIAVAVKYPANFDKYVHEEEILGSDKWQIDLGGSNRKMFNSIFYALFDSVTVVKSQDDLKTLQFDAYIEPEIDAFEFSVPAQSRTPAYSVWIRYRLKIFDAEGTQVANWPVSAYGKSRGGKIGGADSLREAANLAMRDAAAVIGIQMDKATGVSKLRRGVPAPAGGNNEVTPETASAQRGEVDKAQVNET